MPLIVARSTVGFQDLALWFFCKHLPDTSSWFMIYSSIWPITCCCTRSSGQPFLWHPGTNIQSTACSLAECTFRGINLTCRTLWTLWCGGKLKKLTLTRENKPTPHRMGPASGVQTQDHLAVRQEARSREVAGLNTGPPYCEGLLWAFRADS